MCLKRNVEPPSSDLKKAFVVTHTHTHTPASCHTLAVALLVVVVLESSQAERVGMGSDIIGILLTLNLSTNILVEIRI